VSDAASVSLREVEGGVLIKVAARPGTQDRVMGAQGDALKLGVSAAPERGKANKALAELLAKILGVRKSAVALASGETAREKTFLVEGLGLSAVRAALEKALA
jgi:uncharacterized protein (TIGR00251 family)